MSFCEFAQLYIKVILFSAWDKSCDPRANWGKLTHVDHLRWVKSAQFCWTCKAPLTRNASGCQLKCSNKECGNVFHPQTSPVGISLIASEDHSRALLIRQSIYPPGMYSCVAGNFFFHLFSTLAFFCDIFFLQCCNYVHMLKFVGNISFLYWKFSPTDSDWFWRGEVWCLNNGRYSSNFKKKWEIF